MAGRAKRVLRRLVRGVLVVGTLALVLFVYGRVAGALERRRTEVALPRAAAPAPARVDPAALMADVRTLASPEYEGRRTGTPGGRKARAFVEARFRALGLQPVGGAAYAHPFTFEHFSIKGALDPARPARTRYDDAANVVALVKGTRWPERYLVVTAHYDHEGVRGGALFAGADDNASGVAVLLALAAQLQAQPPAHSVLLVALDAEERGLRGAKAFLEAPPVPREAMVADVNMDMVSRQDFGRVFVAGTSPWPALRPAVERAAAGARVPVHLGHDRGFLRAGTVEDWTDLSDHGVFHDAGIPYLYVGVEDHPDYHTPGDVPERIDPAFFASVADFVVELVRAVDAAPGGA